MKYSDLKHSLLFIHQKYPFAAMLLLVIFYFLLIWGPANLWMAHIKASIIRDQQSLIWMKQGVAEIMNLRALPLILKGKSFLFIVNTEIKHLPMGKFVTGATLIHHNVAQITYANIDFDELIQGIEQLAENKQIYVTKMSVYRTGVAGQVNAVVQLQL